MADPTSRRSSGPAQSRAPSKQGHRTAETDLDTLDIVSVCLGLFVLAGAILRHAPSAYMDEPFHIGQTQRYCRRDFGSWDPKITTFPGLYITGVVYAEALFRLARVAKAPSLADDICQTTPLRTLNVILAAAALVVVCKIYWKLHPQVSGAYCLCMGVLLTFFPLQFFFIFLYYTDTGAALFIMASYLACLNGRFHASALLAAVAVLFRQTNAVWAGCVLVAAVSRRCFRHDRSKWRDARLEQQVAHLAAHSWQHKHELLRELWSLALVPAAFAAFVVWNGSIVVGDKANHEPAVHFMQPLYFVLFAALALAPVHFTPRRLGNTAQRLLRGFQQQPLTLVRLLGTAAILAHYAVAKYTLVHPFLVSDNRHYTFYIWKDILNAHPLARHMLVPAYLYSGWSVWESLRTSKQLGVFMAAALVCTLVTLIPAKLVEFRYFTTPFMMLVLHMKPAHGAQIYLTIANYALINALTLYVYLFRPFINSDGSQARFMW